MRSIFTVTLLVASLVLAACGTAGAAVCHEDQPCWSWSTMGNHKRGVTVNGVRRVVGPCQFAKLVARKTVTYRPMRGDRWAINHGCEERL